MKNFLILVAHGSKDPRWQKTFEDLKNRVSNKNIKLSYMEFVKPSLMDMVTECVNDDAEIIKILPLFMAGGGHVDRDIPIQVNEAKVKYPNLKIETLKPIGEHSLVIETFCKIINSEL